MSREKSFRPSRNVPLQREKKDREEKSLLAGPDKRGMLTPEGVQQAGSGGPLEGGRIG